MPAATAFKARYRGRCVVCRKGIGIGQWIAPVYDRRRDGAGTDQYAHSGYCLTGYSQQRAVRTSDQPEVGRGGAPRNAMDLIELCENQLGWLPDDHGEVPRRQWREREAGALTRTMRRKPKRFTIEALHEAILLMQRKREQITTKPATALTHVIIRERINPWSPADPAGDLLRDAVDSALQWEQQRSDEDHPHAMRLSRADGDGRRAALHQWRHAGRGPAVLTGSLALVLSDLIELPAAEQPPGSPPAAYV